MLDKKKSSEPSQDKRSSCPEAFQRPGKKREPLSTYALNFVLTITAGLGVTSIANVFQTSFRVLLKLVPVRRKVVGELLLL